MGVLNLVSPTSVDFLNDWPEQNSINCEAIDTYAGPCLTSHSLFSYTPQVIGATTSPNLGVGGFIRGYYYKIFDQIWSWGEMRFGTSGISLGSGVWTFTLPFAVESTYGNGNGNPGRSHILGNALVWNNAVPTNNQPMTVQLNTPTTFQLEARLNSGLANLVASNLIPITWAVQDGILWNARFKRAP